MHRLEELKPIYDGLQANDTQRILVTINKSRDVAKQLWGFLVTADDTFQTMYTLQGNAHPLPRPIPKARAAITRVLPLLERL
jgi:hypothetical protein